MKENIKKKYKDKVIKDKHIENNNLLKSFYYHCSIKKFLNHYLKHGCFYHIHKKDYGDYINKNIVLNQMEKLQRKISNKIILDDRPYVWQYVLEEDKED